MNKIFGSLEESLAASFANTLAAATKGGLTDQVPDADHMLCGKPDSMELVDVFPDGSWEYQDAKDDGDMVTMSGKDAALLAMYLYSPENKALFASEQG